MNENNRRNHVICPVCGSRNVQIIVERDRNNYDITSGVLGAVCFGPIGMLCGICCADGERTRITCTCNDCGSHFNG